jgi:chromosome segregation ATPase
MKNNDDPPAQQVELATKNDLVQGLTNTEVMLREEIQLTASGLRSEMHEMRHGLRAEMQEMKTELRTEMQEMKEELRTEMRQLKDEIIAEVSALIREAIDAMSIGFQRHEERLNNLDKKFDIMSADIKELKSDVSVLKTDVEIIKSDIRDLQTDMKHTKIDISVFKQQMDNAEAYRQASTENLQEDHRRLEYRVGILEGQPLKVTQR